MQSRSLSGTRFCFEAAWSDSRTAGTLGRVPYATIEMRRPDRTAWDYVGRFRAPDNEIAELRALLEDREPYEALSSLPRGIIWDTLDSIREMGCLARAQFHDD